MPYPEIRTVWFIKRVNKRCIECGKGFRKELIIVDPRTFRQFWSVTAILKEEKAGWGDYCWRCATS